MENNLWNSSPQTLESSEIYRIRHEAQSYLKIVHHTEYGVEYVVYVNR